MTQATLHYLHLFSTAAFGAACYLWGNKLRIAKLIEAFAAGFRQGAETATTIEAAVNDYRSAEPKPPGDSAK